jgi:hypothetical protein
MPSIFLSLPSSYAKFWLRPLLKFYSFMNIWKPAKIKPILVLVADNGVSAFAHGVIVAVSSKTRIGMADIVMTFFVRPLCELAPTGFVFFTWGESHFFLLVPDS